MASTLPSDNENLLMRPDQYSERALDAIYYSPLNTKNSVVHKNASMQKKSPYGSQRGLLVSRGVNSLKHFHFPSSYLETHTSKLPELNCAASAELNDKSRLRLDAIELELEAGYLNTQQINFIHRPGGSADTAQAPNLRLYPTRKMMARSQSDGYLRHPSMNGFNNQARANGKKAHKDLMYPRLTSDVVYHKNRSLLKGIGTCPPNQGDFSTLKDKRIGELATPTHLRTPPKSPIHPPRVLEPSPERVKVNEATGNIFPSIEQLTKVQEPTYFSSQEKKTKEENEEEYGNSEGVFASSKLEKSINEHNKAIVPQDALNGGSNVDNSYTSEIRSRVLHVLTSTRTLDCCVCECLFRRGLMQEGALPRTNVNALGKYISETKTSANISIGKKQTQSELNNHLAEDVQMPLLESGMYSEVDDERKAQPYESDIIGKSKISKVNEKGVLAEHELSGGAANIQNDTPLGSMCSFHNVQLERYSLLMKVRLANAGRIPKQRSAYFMLSDLETATKSISEVFLKRVTHILEKRHSEVLEIVRHALMEESSKLISQWDSHLKQLNKRITTTIQDLKQRHDEAVIVKEKQLSEQVDKKASYPKLSSNLYSMAVAQPKVFALRHFRDAATLEQMGSQKELEERAAFKKKCEQEAMNELTRFSQDELKKADAIIEKMLRHRREHEAAVESDKSRLVARVRAALKRLDREMIEEKRRLLRMFKDHVSKTPVILDRWTSRASTGPSSKEIGVDGLASTINHESGIKTQLHPPTFIQNASPTRPASIASTTATTSMFTTNKRKHRVQTEEDFTEEEEFERMKFLNKENEISPFEEIIGNGEVMEEVEFDTLEEDENDTDEIREKKRQLREKKAEQERIQNQPKFQIQDGAVTKDCCHSHFFAACVSRTEIEFSSKLERSGMKCGKCLACKALEGVLSDGPQHLHRGGASQFLQPERTLRSAGSNNPDQRKNLKQLRGESEYQQYHHNQQF